MVWGKMRLHTPGGYGMKDKISRRSFLAAAAVSAAAPRTRSTAQSLF